MKAINALHEIWNGFDFSYLLEVLLSVIPALLCITLHELSHGLTAYALGDDTAKRAGRLTLNPIKHLDIMGLLMMVIFRFGYAKPVPVDMRKFRNPKRGMAITALAGPMSNVLIGILALFFYGLLFFPLRNSVVGGYVLQMVFITSYLSFAMAVFNLLPVPPLDGSKVLLSLLPEDKYRVLLRYERYGMIALAVLLFTGVLGAPLSALMNGILDLLWPVAEVGGKLYNLIV